MNTEFRKIYKQLEGHGQFYMAYGHIYPINNCDLQSLSLWPGGCAREQRYLAYNSRVK